MENEEILTKSRVIEMTKRSATSLWRDVRAGRFPAPRQAGPGRVGWLKSEVLAWMENLPVVTNGGGAKV